MGEEGVENGVAPGAVGEDVIAQAAFPGEAEPGDEGDRCGIVWPDGSGDAVQPQGGEPEMDDGARGVERVAAAPVVRGDRGTEFGGLDPGQAQPGEPDQPVIGVRGNGQVVLGAGVCVARSMTPVSI